VASTDDPIFGFSKSDAERIAEATRRVLGMPPRGPNQTRRSGLVWHPKGILFQNDSGESMPPGSLGAIKSYQLSGDENYFFAVIEKPGTTFRRQYLINTGEEAVADGETGFCEFSDTYRIAHDTSWAPATGESGGPKPGSWLLWKGYPAICNVIGRANVASDILLGTLSPITTLLCYSTDAITPGPTTDYVIVSGSMASPVDAGFTTVPSVEFGVDVDSDLLFKATWINNGWIGEPLQCNAE
jgi:hypothetical protein